jgi:predicted PurR-regulated permease PerM
MPGWRILLWIVLVLTTVLFLYLVRGILLPFVVAAVISALLEPSVRRLRRRGWPRGLAIWTIVGAFLGVFVAFIIWMTPIVSQQVGGFRARIDTLTAELTAPEETANFFVRWDPLLQVQRPDTKDPIDRLLEQNAEVLARANLPTTKRALFLQYVEPQRPRLGAQIQKFLQSFLGVASGLVSQVMILSFVPLLVLLMLFNMEGFRRRSATWIPPAIRANTLAVLSDVGEVFLSYLRGVSIAVGGYMLFFAVVMTVLGAPFGVLLGVLFGALYLIPYLNGILSGILLLTMTVLSGRTGNFLFDTGSPWTFALILLAIYLACHMIFDALIYPRYVGKAVGLDPIVSMFVIFSGGALFGLVGMVIAFPLAGAVKVILDRLIRITSTSHEGLTLPAVPLRHRSSPNP